MANHSPSLISQFETIVQHHQDKLAIQARDKSLTYQELNHAANRVAHFLNAQYRIHQQPIPLLLEAGISQIIGILGVLKTHNICVPLDIAAPPSRLMSICRELQAPCLLTQDSRMVQAHQLDIDPAHIITLDTLVNDTIPMENPPHASTPQDLAVILFTSGSTGIPKSVVHDHRNLLEYTRWHTKSLRITTADRALLLANCSHIAGLTDTFRILLNGASLFAFRIRDEGIDQLQSWIQKKKITIFHSIPRVFRQLAERPSSKDHLSSLRVVHVGGEPLTKKEVDLFQKNLFEHCILLNNFGSTETSTIRQHFIDKDSIVDFDVIPVGYPVENKKVLILDEEGKEIGPGQIGEIAIESDFVTKGQWRNGRVEADKNFMKFGEGERTIYRTGDLGCLLPNECLQHLGRKDFQVKIRGYRIELGEIEAKLCQHPIVQESVVVCREDTPGEKHLVAYIVGQTSASDLRLYLQARLPEYMVPAAFVTLEQLPLTPNGKINRQALPPPKETDRLQGQHSILPRTPIERTLATIWQQVLGLQKIGIYDNFFELGGHSLLATQVVSRIRKELGVDLKLLMFFEVPTIRALAEGIEGVMWMRTGQSRQGFSYHQPREEGII